VTPVELAVLACVAGSVFVFGLATLGLFRLPDFYSRAHATSKADTLGTLFAVAGAGIALGLGNGTVKLVLLLVFVLVTTPTATHAIVRAATIEGYAAQTTARDGAAREGRTGGDDS
jgi:multicomponent Na+:H+ antiporter subunit G